MSADDHLSDLQFSDIDRRPGRNTWRIKASIGTRQVGRLYWNDTDSGPVVSDIHVHPDHRRQGVASELYRRASEFSGAPLGHSPERTESGDAWARGVGGSLPGRKEIGES